MAGGSWGVPILTVVGGFGVPVLGALGEGQGEQRVLGGRCGGIWEQGVTGRSLWGSGWGFRVGGGLTLGCHGERGAEPGHTGGLRGQQRWVGLGGGLGPRLPTGRQLHLHTVMDKLLLHRARGRHWGGRGTHTGDHGGLGDPLEGTGLALGGAPRRPRAGVSPVLWMLRPAGRGAGSGD